MLINFLKTRSPRLASAFRPYPPPPPPRRHSGFFIPAARANNRARSLLLSDRKARPFLLQIFFIHIYIKLLLYELFTTHSFLLFFFRRRCGHCRCPAARLPAAVRTFLSPLRRSNLVSRTANDPIVGGFKSYRWSDRAGPGAD